MRQAASKSGLTRALQPAGRSGLNTTAETRSRPGAPSGPTGSRVITQESSGRTPRTRSAHSTTPNAGCVPVVGDPEILERSRVWQAVRIEMVDRNAAFVFLNQDECRARNGGRIDRERFGERPYQSRFACSQRTDQADDDARLDQLGERAAESRGIGFRVEAGQSACCPLRWMSIARC